MMTTWINHGLMIWKIQPMFFYGILGFLMLAVLSKLPETYGKELLDWIPGDTQEETQGEAVLRLEDNNCKDKDEIIS